MKQQSPHEEKPTPSGGGWLLGALVVYLLPLIAVAVDELALKTYWFAGQSPGWVKHFLAVIYPFLRGLD